LYIVYYVIHNFYPNSNIVLLGDFNLPFTNFTNVDSIFFDYLDNLNLVQHNNILNSNSVLLDLIISNYKSLIVTLNNFPVINIDSPQPPIAIYVTVESGIMYNLINNEIKYNWVKAD